jgi:hypothetical protein
MKKEYAKWCVRWELQPELCYKHPEAWAFLIAGVLMLDVNIFKALRIRL